MVIEVSNLCFSYTSKKQTLNNVSFCVNKGEWVSILGHNGSGKSTISKLLIGLLEPSSGEIKYDNKLLTAINVEEIRKKVGIVFQNPDNQFVGFNVKYDIAFGLENRNTPRDVMQELILEYSKKVYMDKYLNKEPVTLSGGQKQRVAIAGILALNSEIIIFDEATSMLDPEGTNDIIKLLKILKTEYNKTIITITHDLKLASLSDKIIVLKEGEVIANGSVEEIYNLEELLNSSNLLVPFNLRLYKDAKSDEVLNKNKELMELLWESSLNN